MMTREIDLALWCRRIVLAVWLLLAAAVGMAVVAKFWEGWSLGAGAHQEASRTLDRCARGGDDYDTKHFQRGCDEASRDLAKDPLVYAIEHAWDKLWPCQTAFCVEAVAHLTRSIWTILAVSVLLSLAAVYFMGCSGRGSSGPQIMWAPPPRLPPPHCHTDHPPNSCILDVEKMRGKAD